MVYWLEIADLMLETGGKDLHEWDIEWHSIADFENEKER